MKYQEFAQKNELFVTKNIGDGIYMIQDIVGVEMYLIEGSKRAALLDTGIGIGNVREVAEKLTDKPITVLLTHGHVDHAGGIYNFQEAYLSAKDDKLLKKHTQVEFRIDFASAYLPVLREIEDLKEHMAYRDEFTLHYMKPGDCIELGNRTLKIVDLRGHTRGSIGFYDDVTQTLFAGDAGNNSTFLFLEESSSVTEYKRMLLELKKQWMGKVKRYVICHGYIELPLQVIDELIECCDLVLQEMGSNKEFIIPYEPFQNGHSYWAAEGEDQRQLMDGKNGNIIYDIRKI